MLWYCLQDFKNQEKELALHKISSKKTMDTLSITHNVYDNMLNAFNTHLRQIP